MSALAGFWSFRGEGAAHACARMLRAQTIYGPDASAQWGDAGIALGRRLYRTLPEDIHDRQPEIGANGIVLVADARLDNRNALAAELGLGAGDTARLADSAILLRAFERWGTSAVARLVGDFAFALWDPRAATLTLGRDPMGHRPLHFHRGDGFVAFASMPKGLHTLPEIPHRVDSTGLIDFLAQLPETGAGTFFDGIEKVAPGALVEIGRAGVTARAWWQPALTPIRYTRPEDYVEGLRERMDAAVAARLRGANGRVAAHLSGGLDSATVTATAASLLRPSGGTVAAFTAAPRPGFDGGLDTHFSDESGHAAAVAALHANIEHRVIRSGDRSPLAALDRNFFLFERPIPNLCNGVWTDAINDAARDIGARVLLTGSCGNLGFSWPGLTALPSLLRAGRLLRLAAIGGRLARNGVKPRSVAALTLGPFVPPALWKTVRRMRGHRRELDDYSVLSPGIADLVAERAACLSVDLTLRPRLDGVAARLWALGRTDPGTLHQGTLAGWGLDLRDPTADIRLIEYCLRIPDEIYLAGGVPRGLARMAFADRLPAIVTGEQRKGYQAADWHEGLAAAREDARAEAARIGGAPAAGAFIDADMLARLVEDFPDGGWNDLATIQRYRGALLRGLSAGHFVRKAGRLNT